MIECMTSAWHMYEVWWRGYKHSPEHQMFSTPVLLIKTLLTYAHYLEISG